jgi:RHS repeat-associated protein
VARDESGRALTDYKSEPVSLPCNYTWADRYQKDYVWIGGQALVTYQRGEGMRYAALSPLGMPEYLFDNGLSTVGRTKLSSFGLDLGSTGTERHRFTGHARSHVVGGDGTSLPMADYMHARDYVPMLSRFVSPDPLNEFHLHDPQSFNRYAYVGNDPVNKFDPFGLEGREGSVQGEITAVAKDPGDEDTRKGGRRGDEAFRQFKIWAYSSDRRLDAMGRGNSQSLGLQAVIRGTQMAAPVVEPLAETIIDASTFLAGGEVIGLLPRFASLTTLGRLIGNYPFPYVERLRNGLSLAFGRFRPASKAGVAVGGRVTKLVDPSGKTVKIFHETYDRFGNVIKVREALPGVSEKGPHYLVGVN